MKERGEITILCTLLLLTCMGLVLLCGLELQKSFKLLEKRTHLFLCVKETKGELNSFIKFMGQSNWGIKNANRASLVMMFIPGLQGAALDVQKVKKYIQYAQEARTISYLKTLSDIHRKSCPLDPRMLITPFKFGKRLLERDSDGAAELREEEWTYYYASGPYLLSLTNQASRFERIKPKIKYYSEEKAAKLSSHLSSVF